MMNTQFKPSKSITGPLLGISAVLTCGALLMGCAGNNPKPMTSIAQNMQTETAMPDTGPLWLRATMRREVLQFTFSVDGASWTQVGPDLDATILSDDYHKLGFTGAFIGLCAQDFTGQKHPADFDFFDYRELDA